MIVFAVIAFVASLSVVFTSFVRILHVSNVSVTATLLLFTPAIDYLSECEFVTIVLSLETHHEVPSIVESVPS